MSRTIAILGGRTGLLGVSLTKEAEKQGYEVIPLGREDFDPTDRVALRAFLQDSRPDALFNTVAYTAVDLAEDEVDAAYELNEKLPLLLAEECSRTGCRLYHYSTDFVFTGEGRTTPFTPADTPEPASVYGKSKLAGEEAVLRIKEARGAIIRTSWLFGPSKTNFVEKIVGFAKQRKELTVVGDQYGSPTYTPDLASYSLAYYAKNNRQESMELIHIANSGKASWCELAAEAVKLSNVQCKISPIRTDQWPAKAARPVYSVLDTSLFSTVTEITPRNWKESLAEYIKTKE